MKLNMTSSIKIHIKPKWPSKPISRCTGSSYVLNRYSWKLEMNAPINTLITIIMIPMIVPVTVPLCVSPSDPIMLEYPTKQNPIKLEMSPTAWCLCILLPRNIQLTIAVVIMVVPPSIIFLELSTTYTDVGTSRIEEMLNPEFKESKNEGKAIQSFEYLNLVLCWNEFSFICEKNRYCAGLENFENYRTFTAYVR